jgi:predicted nucleic-acid-binding Zn-ribbon protein
MLEPEVNGRQQSTGRPFPWICPKCRKKEVRPATISYQTERLHDGRLVAVKLPHLNVRKCANCGELVFNYAADEQILDAVKAQATATQSTPA